MTDEQPAEGAETLIGRCRDLLENRPDAVIAGPTAAALWIDALGGIPPGDDREAHLELVPALAVAPLEMVVPGRGARPAPGTRVRADRLDAGETREVQIGGGTVRLTSPVRTAFDLARGLPLDEAVTVVDAIAARHAVRPDDLRRMAHHHPGVRGRRAVFPVADRVDHGSTSPARTRVRLVLRRGGVDAPLAGRAIVDRHGALAGLLDLAWLDDGCGLQVGRTRPEALARTGRLGELGWFVQLIPDEGPADWLVHQARGLLARRRGRVPPPLAVAFARRPRRPSGR
ncbi:hypothetical protein [Actinomycetospora cinnamomea]|uniref:Transcriptional regulator with AbiEi antitoxin domain of type IV toxin-antitoxin system n=1 Tax=Actinomycetospora cinnamomea TaxID=663609 RepID=A0A2U1EU76_9PSEU|nr:hypothetical protein [Actinomycetospora cinnamomea]PVZ03467.1 hypothetical protein C8D89_12168 [Actinomycetospora cinnamomea]